MHKNILIISSKSADFGGVEFHVLDLIRAFSPENKIYVICPEGPLVSEYISSGAEVITKVPKAPYDFNFAIYVKNFCKEKSIDVVHAHELISAQGLFGAFLAGVSVRVWHVHTPFLYWKNKSILVKILKSIPNWLTNFIVGNFFATVVLALTLEIKKHRKIAEGIVFKPIVVIPNSVNLDVFSKIPTLASLTDFKKRFAIPNDKTIIGTVSRTTFEKGQIILFNAFKELNNKFPNKYFLLLAGGGELENELNSYGNKNFKENFLITGKFKDSDKVMFYKILNYFVFPSLAEGFGYAPVEAAASKKIIIESDLPVLKRIGGDSVYFFKTGDYKDLYKVLLEVISTPADTITNKIQANFKKIQEYSFENFKKNYAEIYKL